MKFSKSTLSRNALNALESIVKTYAGRGGFEMQINVVDANTLKAARAEPEKYRDLIVRIGGYSDYFVRLSENMQNEVIARTEHKI